MSEHIHIHCPEWPERNWATMTRPAQIEMVTAIARPGVKIVRCDAPCETGIGVHPAFAPPSA